jgi:hypothetical protein
MLWCLDGMSGNGQIAFDEQAVAYILTSAPIVSPKITSRTDMVNFGVAARRLRHWAAGEASFVWQ